MNNQQNNMDPIDIDGSQGEGGGQILRTALSLSMITGRTVRLTRIRAGRKKPGLLRQHLAAVRAAKDLCSAQVEGDRPGSEALTFTPGPVGHGDYRVVIGTAGSTSLVLQTVLPAMLTAPGPSTIHVFGGTHNPMSPPIEFLQRSFLPLLKRMGAEVSVELIRPGFYPAGGGELRMTAQPCDKLQPLELKHRGGVKRRQIRAVVAGLSESIARREIKEVHRHLEIRDVEVEIVSMKDSISPGNVLQLILESDGVTEVFTAFGQLGVSSEQVARDVCKQAQKYLAADVPVGRFLADQLLLPFAMAGGGRFRTLRPSGHTLTNIQVIERFLPVSFRVEKLGDGMVDLFVEPKGEKS
ncbi:MAG: RNA 3'-terminal phosphate cyclase [Kiritimatiellae bacterium]|nr:RNA 3'-terminal phosphate cyclase [Kiritimatiellia bacterium]